MILHVHTEKPISMHVSGGDSAGLNVSAPFVVRPSPIAVNGLPQGGNPGDVLLKSSSGDYAAEWTPTADHSEADNTRPITAAAVYAEIGNINALLAII